MSLPPVKVSGPISFTDIKNAFTGTISIRLSHYYNNYSTGYVKNNSSIPSSGAIKMSNFYRQSRQLKLPVIIDNSNYVFNFINISNTNYYYCKIIPTSNYTNNINVIFSNSLTGKILLVGGGGGGGGSYYISANENYGGGGGGGGSIYYNNSYIFLENTTYTIIIGAEGIGGLAGNSTSLLRLSTSSDISDGTNGGTTSMTTPGVSTINATGGIGGKGVAKSSIYVSDISGDGGNTSSIIIINNSTTSSTYSGQSGKIAFTIGSGGGGAGGGGPGGDSTTAAGNNSGIGGIGYSNDITGTSTFYSYGGQGTSSLSTQIVNIRSYPLSNYGNAGNAGNSSSSSTKGQSGTFGVAIIAFTFTLYSFTNMTFTPANAVGNTGPTLNNLIINYNTNYPSYLWINHSNYFNSNNGIQLWTVPANGTYKITVAGAGAMNGKKGYAHYITTILTINQQLTLIVGQKGTNGHGGGGSFVFKGTDITSFNNLLICAGGAGGDGDDGSMYATSGYNGGYGAVGGGTGGAPNNNGNNGNYEALGPDSVINYGGKCGSSWINAGLFGSSIGSFGGGGIQYQPWTNGTYYGKPGKGGGGGYNGGGGGGGGGDGYFIFSSTPGGAGGGGGGGGSYPTSGTIQVSTVVEANGYITIELL